MNIKTIAGALTIAGITSASASTITWGGSDGDFGTAANWVGGVLPNVTNGTDDAVINAGAVTDGARDFNAGSQLSVTGAGTSYTATGNTRLRGAGGNAATHTVDAGTLAGTLLVIDDQQILNFTNGGSGVYSGNVELNVNSNLNLTDSTLSATNLTLLSYAGSSSFLNLFDGGQLTLSGTITQQTLGNGFVNFDSASSTGSVFFSTLDVTAAQALVTDQKFAIGGTTNTTLGDYIFTAVDGGGVTVTVVPEPSSTALLGLGGLALILRRRK